ncbi:sensor histidine kinase [Pinibacter aurantiacus]|uniref:GAF domain-containing protein n=1 Tax=Pinibacter aurantiacus TaxID=2851599 RepID=A0A9E2SFY0_9BACT|nr:GAF domain-containing protein [Pinibacter aurantiacus]MBV4359650.1 GAF domain-containing protein [Pinibacter aurantiacus]
MRKAHLPLDEEIRLSELEGYNIMYTPPEKEFDDLAELVKQITHCTYAAISFIDKDRQWYKASVGSSRTEVPRELSFCSHTILQKDTLVVPNATLDERFAGNPAVTGGAFIRFYAGTPIVSSNGYNIGTVCVCDSRELSFDDQQVRAMEIIALQVTKLLELRKRNALILKKADALIDIERKTLQRTLNEQEKERQLIGIELHENFAQIVASCLMYLNVAEDTDSASAPFVQKAKRQLGSLVDEMRKLSKSFNPINVPCIDLEDILSDFLLQLNRKPWFDIEMKWKDKATNIPSDLALNIFRITAQFLEMLACNGDKVEAIIYIDPSQAINVKIDCGSIINSTELLDEQSLTFNTILNRIELHGGMYELRTEDNRISFRCSFARNSN